VPDPAVFTTLKNLVCGRPARDVAVGPAAEVRGISGRPLTLA
jgi:hypothetical protein